MVEETLSAFTDAYATILNISEKHMQLLIEKFKNELLLATNLLRNVRENNGYIHIAGAGRSKIAGEIFGELLKNLGFNVSTIGDTLSKPVRKNDVIIAVSSSGWTTTTLFAVEQSLKIGAKIIGLTATFGSKLDRLADITIPLPGKPNIDETPYIVRQMMGRHKTPLTPMGTVSEINTILIGIGITSMLRNIENSVDAFRDSLKKIFSEAKENYKLLSKIDNIINDFIAEISKGIENKNKKYFLIGLGICDKISQMSAMRYQHLSLNVQPIDNWRFRESSDVLIAISGSGENPYILLYAEEAKRSKMKVLSLTANENSTLTSLSDVSIVFKDISLREDYVKLRVGEETKIFLPIFEVISLLFLESTVAQVAEKYQISEEIMRAMHANVE